MKKYFAFIFLLFPQLLLAQTGGAGAPASFLDSFFFPFACPVCPVCLQKKFVCPVCLQKKFVCPVCLQKKFVGPVCFSFISAVCINDAMD